MTLTVHCLKTVGGIPPPTPSRKESSRGKQSLVREGAIYFFCLRCGRQSRPSLRRSFFACSACSSGLCELGSVTEGRLNCFASACRHEIRHPSPNPLPQRGFKGKAKSHAGGGHLFSAFAAGGTAALRSGVLPLPAAHLHYMSVYYSATEGRLRRVAPPLVARDNESLPQPPPAKRVQGESKSRAGGGPFIFTAFAAGGRAALRSGDHSLTGTRESKKDHQDGFFDLAPL